MTIRLVPLSEENWIAAARLSVAPEQESFVAANVWSIAQGRFLTSSQSHLIYAGDELVGFLMHGEPEGTTYWLYRFMIDQRYQGRGYGRAALQAFIDLIRQDRPDMTEIRLSFIPANAGAERLYRSVGFELTGEIEDGEVVAMLALRPGTS